MSTIHPANLTAAHIGKTVRWERGTTLIQGRLEAALHAYDLVGPDGFEDRSYDPCLDTLFTIQGAEPVLVHASDDRAILTIIEETPDGR